MTRRIVGKVGLHVSCSINNSVDPHHLIYDRFFIIYEKTLALSPLVQRTLP